MSLYNRWLVIIIGELKSLPIQVRLDLTEGLFGKFDLFEIGLIQINMFEWKLLLMDIFTNRLFCRTCSISTSIKCLFGISIFGLYLSKCLKQVEEVWKIIVCCILFWTSPDLENNSKASQNKSLQIWASDFRIKSVALSKNKRRSFFSGRKYPRWKFSPFLWLYYNKSMDSKQGLNLF